MDFELSSEQRMILEYGDRVAQRFDRRYWMSYAEKHEPPKELFEQIAADGFLGLMVPEAYGGGGQGMLEMALFMEGLSNNGIPLLSLVVNSTMSLALIAMHGTEEQKQKYLPAACRGEIKFCFAITEPDAGSNTIEISTLARREGRGFRLKGQKTFITDADAADYALVVARTRPHSEVARKTDGFTLFILDMRRPGVSKTAIPVSIPMPESQWQLFFDDVELAEGDALGTVDDGFRILFDTLNPERIILSALCVGIGRYALRRAVGYASERKVFNKVPIGAYQGLQHPLAAAHAEVELAGLMTHKAAWAFDRRLPAGEYANMAKYAAAEAGIHAVDAAIQCFGGNGFTKEYGMFDLYPMVRLLRTAPLNREMVLNYIGEKVMGLPRSY
ncbi:MAG: acyl-CoA dehydrogenase family protein [Pseudomonadota bacterium]